MDCFFRIILNISLLGSFWVPIHASESILGPVSAEVVRIIDGDTLRVRAHIWINQHIEVNVRLRDIDAPEFYHPRCEAEKGSARAARDELRDIAGKWVFLHNIRNDKYGGRIVANARTQSGEDLGMSLMNKGHAVSYGVQPPWCDIS